MPAGFYYQTWVLRFPQQAFNGLSHLPSPGMDLEIYDTFAWIILKCNWQPLAKSTCEIMALAASSPLGGDGFCLTMLQNVERVLSYTATECGSPSNKMKNS